MSPTNYAYVFCGDGFVQRERGEKCDSGYDKNGLIAANCSITCQPISTSPTCGNRIVDPGEECDDGKTRNVNDVCTDQCKEWGEAARCGDGKITVSAGEQCDEGVAKNGSLESRCTVDCKKKVTQQCGDGRLDSGEECDNGVLNGNYAETTCLKNCIFPYCGDRVIGLSEQCDDGNEYDFDGCDHTCVSEASLFASDQLVDGFGGKNGGLYGEDGFGSKNNPFGGNLTGTNGGYDSNGRYYGNIPTPARTPTGPGLVIFLVSGAAAGIGLVRRRYLK